MSLQVQMIQGGPIESVDAQKIDMYALLVYRNLWLLIEGYLYGYAATEDAVDRLHQLVHFYLADKIN